MERLEKLSVPALAFTLVSNLFCYIFLLGLCHNLMHFVGNSAILQGTSCSSPQSFFEYAKKQKNPPKLAHKKRNAKCLSILRTVPLKKFSDNLNFSAQKNFKL